MQVHDWTRVEAGTFHHFHTAWTTHLSEALNEGRLPPGYYALAEQHMGRKIADVLTLHASDPEQLRWLPEPTDGGAVAVAETPPRVSRSQVLTPSLSRRRRTLTIRHTTGHRIVALVEIVSPSNIASADGLRDFVKKAEEVLRAGIHLVVLDLFPPSKHDPEGMHGAILKAHCGETYDLPRDKPLTLVSYAASTEPVAYLEHLAVGDLIVDMPLFLSTERYVNLPLETTYTTAYRGVPAFWREVLEGRRNFPGE